MRRMLPMLRSTKRHSDVRVVPRILIPAAMALRCVVVVDGLWLSTGLLPPKSAVALSGAAAAAATVASAAAVVPHESGLGRPLRTPRHPNKQHNGLRTFSIVT
eukprot:GHVU01029363.1.p1 GENE.GHVU01029363.1~~GHVU01029363.1.p1  ORF type:complete len:103 (+),score=5.27 GHVU01029363.1:917-1225(+)